MTRIISVANQKGGVGKTTTVINLAAVLASKKKTVLVLDLDPQANASSGLGVAPADGVSIYPALLDPGSINSVIVGTVIENVNVIPSEVNLVGAEIELARAEDHLSGLRNALKPVVDSGVFDYILIDCPPSLGILMSNALAASDAVLIPMQCEYYSMEGLSVITGIIERMRNSGDNPKLAIEGILMTMSSRNKLSEEVMNQVRSHYPDIVYETVIPRGVRAGEAPSFGLPVVAYAPSSSVAIAYGNLGAEFLRREREIAAAASKVDSMPDAPGPIEDKANEPQKA